MKRTHEDLVNTCAEICYYAQENSSEYIRWEHKNTLDLEYKMQNTSYTIACFIAQNTKFGEDGVEWEIVLKKLCEKVLTLEQWKQHIEKLIKKYGGAFGNQ